MGSERHCGNEIVQRAPQYKNLLGQAQVVRQIGEMNKSGITVTLQSQRALSRLFALFTKVYFYSLHQFSAQFAPNLMDAVVTKKQ